MATRNPTLSGRWGESAWAQFDYWRNPVRVGVDAAHPNGQNPCIFYRPGGGGTGGNHQDIRTDAYGDPFFLFHWLGGAHATSNPGSKWDLCSFSSGQQMHVDFFTGLQTLFPRTRSLFFPDAIRDCQRAIASIKGQAATLGFDPNKVVGWGDSYGATLLGLSQLAPPLGGGNRRSVWRDGTNLSKSYDSTLRGLLYHQGQIDCRKIGGVDYLAYQHCAAWFGTRYNDSGEFNNLPDAVRAMASARAYIEAGETGGYRGWFLAYVSGVGAGTHPLADPHDTVQAADLETALVAKGLTYAKQVRSADSWRNTNWPNNPGAPELALYNAADTFLAARIA